MMELAFRSRGGTTPSAADDKKRWYKKAGTPLLGEDLAHRRKQMFTVPIGDWFHGGCYPWLGGSEWLGRLFKRREIGSILARHRDGSANLTRELRALALWEGAVVTP